MSCDPTELPSLFELVLFAVFARSTVRNSLSVRMPLLQSRNASSMGQKASLEISECDWWQTLIGSVYLRQMSWSMWLSEFS